MREMGHYRVFLTNMCTKPLTSNHISSVFLLKNINCLALYELDLTAGLINCFFGYSDQWRAGRGPWPLRGKVLGGAKPVKRGAKCMEWNKNVDKSVKSFQALLQER